MKDIIMPGLWIGLLSIVFIILFFLILRELFCWYWKINKRVHLQEETNLMLEEILKELKTINISPQIPFEKKLESKNKVKVLYETEELNFPEE